MADLSKLVPLADDTKTFSISNDLNNNKNNSISMSTELDEALNGNGNGNDNDDDDDDDDQQQAVKTKIIKCKTNNQQAQTSSYNILTANGSSSTAIHSLDVPNEHTSIKINIRRVCSPSSNEPAPVNPSSANHLPQRSIDSTEQTPSATKIISRKFFNSNELTNTKTSRRPIATRRTSLIEADSSSIYDLPKTLVNNHTTVYDENSLKNQIMKMNGNKRKVFNEQQEKKRTKLTTRTVKQQVNTTKPSNPPVQVRSSTRLKQKYNPASDHQDAPTDKRSSTTKRHLSTELITTQTSDHSTTTSEDIKPGEYKYLHSSLASSSATKQYTTGECQTTDDIIEVSHQSIQTNHLIKSDKSTYTDFIDRPLCENSTQTIRKEEQETQTTDLNCPNDSQVYLYDMKSSQTQCDRISDTC
ncbi:unnamed protein product, partial [Adineta ricciae]